ncbi:MAG: Flagellum-specific ATP synthase [Holosporales bacterium]
MDTDHLFSTFDTHTNEQYFGFVLSLQGLSITVSLNFSFVRVGTRVKIYTQKKCVQGEVIGFSQSDAKVMVFDDLSDVTPGCKAYFCEDGSYLYPDASWCGRILNGLGEPSDDKGPLKKGVVPMVIQAPPPLAYKRAPVQDRLDVGVRAINTFLTLCKGQRMGIFAGSGVGKSMLLSMLIRYTKCDLVVIGLIGERGRELYEFIHHAVGVDNLKKCVIVIATSDEPALMRRQAAYTTMTIAEYFRDQGLSVLCVMDSVTRFAMAQREIGLSCGEPPASKGYTPSVFSILPKLLERAGPGAVHDNMKTGYITGIFTVLVDGDDHNEPIADSVRSILDGHIVLDRSIASRNHYPAINILKSISRTVPACHFGRERDVITKAKQILSTYDDMADMIRIGAYKKGSNKQVDEALLLIDALNNFTKQDFLESDSLAMAFEKLAKITNIVL